jgi:hypothetical protein
MSLVISNHWPRVYSSCIRVVFEFEYMYSSCIRIRIHVFELYSKCIRVYSSFTRHVPGCGQVYSSCIRIVFGCIRDFISATHRTRFNDTWAYSICIRLVFGCIRDFISMSHRAQTDISLCIRIVFDLYSGVFEFATQTHTVHNSTPSGCTRHEFDLCSETTPHTSRHKLVYSECARLVFGCIRVLDSANTPYTTRQCVGGFNVWLCLTSPRVLQNLASAPSSSRSVMEFEYIRIQFEYDSNTYIRSRASLNHAFTYIIKYPRRGHPIVFEVYCVVFDCIRTAPSSRSISPDTWPNTDNLI